MKMGMVFLLLTVFVAVMSSTRVSARSKCGEVKTRLRSCVGVLTGRSGPFFSLCCTSVTNAVKSSRECLCEILNGVSIFGFKIDEDLFRSLAKNCKVKIPPINCKNGKNFKNINL
ncbi:unnamed protein product [Arabidopsis halleri]